MVTVALIAWLILMNCLQRSQARLVQEMDRRLEAEAALRQSQKMEAVGRLAGGIAHDFNNILMAIVGNAEAARRHFTPGHPSARPLERLLEAPDQANRVVRGLLTFSRKSSAERTPVDVRALLDDTVALLDSLLPASIAVRVEADRDRPMWISADPAQMEQALVNLAVNARDAMPMGGGLTFRAFLTKAGTDTATRVCIEVADTGTGMTPDVVEKAFEPFFTTRDKEHGTGLGLSIVHGIVTDHGGTITVDSRPGAGTTMTVSLPALPSPPDIDRAAGFPGAARETGPGGLIVIAEDNAFVRQLMAETLRDAGFDVVQVERGDAIVDTVKREATALRLLVTDVELPGGSGLDAVRSLRAAGYKLPVIAVTGSIDRDLESQIDGTALLLRKPFAMADLERLARRMVRSASTSQTP
jgi:nitrogen-specific signal transduction histidine kinase/ActR/RegA family two-component response regulator